MELRKSDASRADGRPVEIIFPQTTNETTPDLRATSIDRAEVRGCIRSVVFVAVRAAGLLDDYEDYLQEALVYVWQTRSQSPGRALAWYLGRCGCFIRNLMKLGRSVDSPKRRVLRCALASEDEDGGGGLRELISEVHAGQHASADDGFEQLRVRLNPRERTILELLLDGEGVRETARKLGLGRSAVSDTRQHIRAIAIQIGLQPESEFKVRMKPNVKN